MCLQELVHWKVKKQAPATGRGRHVAEEDAVEANCTATAFGRVHEGNSATVPTDRRG